MPPLAEPDIVRHTLDFVHDGRTMATAMRVSRLWHRIGQHILYSVIDIDLGLLGIQNVNTFATRCLDALRASPSNAGAVHHLSIRGSNLNANPQIQVSIRDLLCLSTGLISLELQLQPLGAAQYLPYPMSGLESLSALNTDDWEVAQRLCRLTTIRTIRVWSWPEPDQFHTLLRSIVRTVTHLQLRLQTRTLDDAATMLTDIAASCPYLSLLGVHFLLPGPGEAPWDMFKVFVRRISREFSQIPGLSELSIATTPDPVIRRDPREPRANNPETKTKELAQSLVETDLPFLHRIELRWHGWYVSRRGQWSPVANNELCRLQWYYQRPSSFFQSHLPGV